MTLNSFVLSAADIPSCRICGIHPLANISMSDIRPPRQLGLAVIFFGLCGTYLSAVHNYNSVPGLRLFIGLGEVFMQVSLLYFSF